jgi:signal transduction histidine kinase
MRILLSFCLALLVSLCFSENSKIDSLTNLNRSLTGEEKVNNLIDISREYLILRDSTGIPFALEALNIAKELGFTEGVGKAYLFLGLLYENVNRLKSIEYYIISSDTLTSLNHKWSGFGYENASRLYLNRGWFPEALNVSLKALKAYELANDSLQLTKATSNIGFINERIGNHYENIQWQNKALKIAPLINDSSLTGLIYGRIGISYDEMGQYDSAHYYNKKAVDIFYTLNDDYYLQQWLSNIGNTYLKQGDYIKAEEYINRARKRLITEAEDVNILLNLSRVYLKTKKYQLAISKIDSAIYKAKKLHQNRWLVDAYYIKYEIYNESGNTSSALEYFKKYSFLQDSLLNYEKSEQIAQMKVRYETNQKEKELIIEKANNEKLELDHTRIEIALINRNRWIYIIISLSIIIILAGLFLFQRSKRKSQAEKDASLIKEREKGIQAAFNAQEEERQRIAKDLHDGVGQQISAIKMFQENLSNRVKEKQPELGEMLDRINKLIGETGKEVRNISHHMMPKTLTDMGLVAALEDLLENTFASSEIQYTFDKFGIEERLPFQVELVLFRIAQELFNNIIKHSGANKVDVQVMKMDQHCVLIVQDNGRGFKSDSKSDGIGLMNINNRLNTINGDFDINSESDGGTTATIRIALAQ